MFQVSCSPQSPSSCWIKMILMDLMIDIWPLCAHHTKKTYYDDLQSNNEDRIDLKELLMNIRIGHSEPSQYQLTHGAKTTFKAFYNEMEDILEEVCEWHYYINNSLNVSSDFALLISGSCKNVYLSDLNISSPSFIFNIWLTLIGSS